jgi:hydrogenase/urease accessory protein HupE
MMRRLTFGFLLVALMLGTRAFAHDPGLSSANISRTDGGLKVTLTFAWADLALVGAATNTANSAGDPGAPPNVFGSEWTQAVAGFVRVVADGEAQPTAAISFSRSQTEATDVVVSFEWARISPGPLRVEFPVLANLPSAHRMILTIGDAAEPVAMLRARLAAWELPAASVSTTSPQAANAMEPAAQPRAGWTAFLLLGVEHILIGFDHLCFLLALLLVAVRMREVVALVTTFTVAHSLTLAAAALGIVSLSPRLVEPLIAASIVYVAIENLVLRRQPRYRLVVVFGFGLVHGLGFAGILAERLPGVTGAAVVPPLLAFNAGVELGQLAVAACIVPLIRMARAQPRLAPRLQPALSLLIATAGVVWFFQRV